MSTRDARGSLFCFRVGQGRRKHFWGGLGRTSSKILGAMRGNSQTQGIFGAGGWWCGAVLKTFGARVGCGSHFSWGRTGAGRASLISTEGALRRPTTNWDRDALFSLQRQENDSKRTRTTSNELRWSGMNIRWTKTERHNDRKAVRQEYEKTIKKTHEASRQIPMKWNELKMNQDKWDTMTEIRKDKNTKRQ